MSLHTSYHADSDADDEYERSVITSPRIPTDSEASPTDSEPRSSEHTPTTFSYAGDDRRSPRTVITEWTASESAEFITGLGLGQYRNAFLENEIVGDALIALKHDELKEIGIASVGHRLTILKSVYEAKVKQGVPIDPDDYLPLSADQNTNENATQDDVARLIQSIRLRDEKIISVEAELRRVAEDYRRLREELLPVFKMAKDRSQPLPPPYSTLPGDMYGHDTPALGAASGMNTGGPTSSNNSPTHIPPSIHEGRTYNDSSTLDAPTSSHLTTTMNGSSTPSPGIPSPTSPGGHYGQQPMLASRSYSQPTPGSGNRTTIHDSDVTINSTTTNTTTTTMSTPASLPSRPAPSPATRSDPAPPAPPAPSRSDSRAGEAPSVEIFKSFRVSFDDPCQKVLPAALKKYNINADWRDYALYIVHGDQERCLGLDERPLVVFKQLEKEGRKPMFMLRRQIHSVDSGGPVGSGGSVGLGVSGGGTAYSSTGPGSAPGSASFENGGRSAQINLPGGVL
ncbi:hypothetical protein ASPZODRAFT_647729 [Penicilliopsis zonata CBS 506.65]|uniref:Uncharacterized protein n=1 Tax=Penicilliopsis zonata CBS 506.65 TaxID=1073090 RepID=A0A1L9SCQ4_9EURO|nr:hypothetical protein ASPZODRAFT_647729 [Penicilliopsis zonata CBS 506.65]OJJ44909.1 hypothetical protein ASPZODRAFT_647729 [Penicilliopsis zonata CBS 506.65]